MVWQQKPTARLAEQAAKNGSCKRLSQRASLNTPRQLGTETALPARPLGNPQRRKAWCAVPMQPTPSTQKTYGDGSMSDASTRQHGMWRRESLQTCASEQYICFSAHVLSRQPFQPSGDWSLLATKAAGKNQRRFIPQVDDARG